MKDFANDLAHMVFAMLVLWFPSAGLIGYVLSGALIGILIELKENDPNVMKAIFKGISWRDIGGYALGGFIIGLIMRGW